MAAVDEVVGTHDAQDLAFLDARFEGGQINLAQGAFVHVHHPPPDNLVLVDAQGVAKVQMVIEHRRQQVVGGGHDMEISIEVQIDLLHRRDLGVAAAGAAALDTKARSDGWFPQAEDGFLAQAIEGVGQSDTRGGLAFASGSRMDRSHQDQLACRGVLQPPVKVKADLGLGLAIQVQVLLLDADLGRDGFNWLQLGFLGDFDGTQLSE